MALSAELNAELARALRAPQAGARRHQIATLVARLAQAALRLTEPGAQ